MEKKYLIYTRNKLEDYLDKLEELCFFYEKKVELSVLRYDIGRFVYKGNNFREDAKCLRSIDEMLRIEKVTRCNTSDKDKTQ